MDSLQPRLNTSLDRQFRLGDYGLLLILCAFLYGYSLVQQRVFTTHETVHCLNVREMFASGDWLIPTYGGRPWLERPPLPHWLTGVFALWTGGMDQEWAMRLGSIVVATLAVLVFGAAVASCLGRIIGIMSGAILATTREFSSYATGPEADIFLASTVTIIGALLMRAHFDPSRDEQTSSFFGRRSWRMVLFFLLLGLTNWMKGPLFGMIFILLPLAGYLAWNRSWREFRPFLWFWGWLLVLVVGAAWPFCAYERYPDIVDLWMVDYGVRWSTGYIGEPSWYYAFQQPWNLFPWTISTLVGLVVTARTVARGEVPALRFLWCWAVLPVLFFSLFKGKHHHYLLSCLAPASVLAALGANAFWRWLQDWPHGLRQPWFGFVLVGLPGFVLLLIFGGKIPGPEWVRWLVTFGWPVLAAVTWRVMTHREGRLAFGGCCAIIVAINSLAYSHRSYCLDSYEGDRVFIAEAKARTMDDRPLLVVFDEHPLNSSWLLYYLGERTQLLHNLTFLRGDQLTAPEVYLVCRQRDEGALAEYGVAELLLQSPKTRAEVSMEDRWTLYLLRFHPHLARMPGDVRISPLQATGRQPGPYLGRSVASGEDAH